ncbi:MFS transporter [Kordiimonas marina]|uniref:MFS transporter n=1 Tax=Kordiimonas marina TaxID=2872312 RepID=UPI001FF5B115|nr:MFS transporter [Kordiimonas marina]MCJ9429540.1 MFS transporter [Kordiimonas marina]
MTLRATLISIFALLLGAGALNLGMGLQASLLGVRAGMESFPTVLIGLIMSSYYAGFVVGSLNAAKLVNRVGHIRTFSAFASLTSAAVLLHAVFVNPWAWLGFRAVTGFCVAVLSLVTESWLNERASNLNRGTIISTYFVVTLGATALGQVLLMAAPPSGYQLFVLVSVVISVALVPVALTSSPMPELTPQERMPLKALFNVSPVGLIGSLGAGLIAGSFWGVGAVYGQHVGMTTPEIALFMTLVICGGVATQWPLGKLSDGIDRRYVIAGTTFGITLIAALFTFGGEDGGVQFYVLAALLGGLILPLYGIAIAHANDFLEPQDFVPASASLLLSYGIGAAIGPLAATVVMNFMGPYGLFFYMGVSALGIGLFTLYRMTRRREVPVSPEAETVPAMAPMPNTSAMIYEMDPRSEEQPEDEDAEDKAQSSGA